MASSPPFLEMVADATGRFSRGWVSWLTQMCTYIVSNYQHGTTAERPTTGLWIGRRYFDDTLGKPVYVKTISPIVWVDGVGTVS